MTPSTLTQSSPELYDALRSSGVEAEEKQGGATVPLPGHDSEIRLFRGSEGSDADWTLGFFSMEESNDQGVQLHVPATDDPQMVAGIVAGIMRRVSPEAQQA